ncbi:hypothetical protein SAMN05428975_2608 [Mucilaginibacter sp. OK268]|nr:hypothetical protein SAMN05428975_2608 [Mucilaginibacter sp. OK268]
MLAKSKNKKQLSDAEEIITPYYIVCCSYTKNLKKTDIINRFINITTIETTSRTNIPLIPEPLPYFGCQSLLGSLNAPFTIKHL